jgi:ariadne-1
MHMICKICYHEFCWLCKGTWAEHGDKTGGYYSCNRYDPLKHDTPDLDLRFGKYVHHFQRFTYHTNARKMAENRGAEIKLREPHKEPGEEPWDRAFLYDVLDLALTCRHVLKYTYVFGFFLEDGKEKELFEFLQEDLEKSTEHLTELLFRELDCIAAPISSPADITHLRNYTKVTRKFLESLTAGLHNGLITDYGPPSPEDAYKKGKKKQTKDKKKKQFVWKKDRSKTNI